MNTAEAVKLLPFLAHVKGFIITLDGVNTALGWSIWLRALDGSGLVHAFEGDSESGFMIEAREQAEAKARAFLDREPNRLYL